MSREELKLCPFCGSELIIGKQRIASCKTEGCAVQHRGVDLDYPKHIAAWNRRTPDPAQIRADALREALKPLLNLVDEFVTATWHLLDNSETSGPADDPTIAVWQPDFDEVSKLLDRCEGLPSGSTEHMTAGELLVSSILALIDAPLSPPAVDNSPAPDAGGNGSVQSDWRSNSTKPEDGYNG